MTGLTLKNVLSHQSVLLSHTLLKESFLQKQTIPVVDPAIFFLNKTLKIPVEDDLVFNDPVDKRLEGLFKAFSSLSGPTL